MTITSRGGKKRRRRGRGRREKGGEKTRRGRWREGGKMSHLIDRRREKEESLSSIIYFSLLYLLLTPFPSSFSICFSFPSSFPSLPLTVEKCTVPSFSRLMTTKYLFFTGIVHVLYIYTLSQRLRGWRSEVAGKKGKLFFHNIEEGVEEEGRGG